MKYPRLFIIAIISVMAFIACTDDEKEDVVIGRTYQQSVTLDVQGTEQTITLNDLKSKIDDVKNSVDWLTVLIKPYTSGSPVVLVSAKEHTDTQHRSADVTITDTNGDKVVLAVTQEGAEELKTGIDDSHDVPTDQPAYSR